MDWEGQGGPRSLSHALRGLWGAGPERQERSSTGPVHPQLFTASIPLRQLGFVEVTRCGRKRPIAQLKSPRQLLSASASSKPHTQNREFVAVSSFNYCFRVLLLPKSVIVSLASSERHPPETQGR